MRNRKIVAALAAGLLVAAGGWLLSQKRRSGPDVAVAGSPLLNSAHEKVFLAMQLRGNPTHTPILLRLAQIERSEGDLAAARHHLEQAVAADAGQVDLRLELSLVCSELGDFTAAEEHNRAILRIDPGQPDVLYNLGAIAANRGDIPHAREFWINASRSGRNGDAVEKSRRALQRLETMR